AQIFVGQCGIVDARHDGGGHVLCSLDSVERRVRLQGNTADIRVQLLQSAAGPDKGAAGAKHGNEMRDAAFGLLPDLVGRGFVVSAPVGVVRVLVGVEVAGGLGGGELACLADGAIGALT